jgi:ribonucleoside-diphosphate reductase alpha chain
MMGAVQPFISGAISKTINVPEHATVDEIESAYVESWKLGLKAVAIYRDGCKRVQPLNTSRSPSEKRVAEVPAAQPTRRRLPADRDAICHKFDVAGHEGYLHVGFFEDGTPGEIFIKMAKEGSTVSGLMDSVGVLTSMALQYRVPLEVLVSKFSHVRFEPSGFTKNPDIPMAKSLIDYVVRFLGTRFLGSGDGGPAGDDDRTPTVAVSAATSASPQGADRRIPSGANVVTFNPQADAPSCPDCGSIMVRNGACYKCFNCGATSGCS